MIDFWISEFSIRATTKEETVDTSRTLEIVGAIDIQRTFFVKSQE